VAVIKPGWQDDRQKGRAGRSGAHERTKPEQLDLYCDHQNVKTASLFVSEGDSIRRNIDIGIIEANGSVGIRRTSTPCGGIGAIRPRNVRWSVA
jgi:hypothetical protein